MAEGLPANAVGDIRTALKAAHHEVRAFSYLLHPPDLKRLGLSEALRKFANGFGQRTGLNVELDLEDLHRLSAVVELSLFRIVQEALMNVHRHAHAHAVAVRLRQCKGEIALEIADDGVGVSATHIRQLLKQGGGVGLQGIRARVEQLGGRFAILAPKTGFALKVFLPAAREHG